MWRDLQAFAIDVPNKGNAPPPATSKAKWNRPFPCAIAPFPVKRTIPPPPDSSKFGNPLDSRDDLPDYLPSYPPAHTYKRAKRRIGKKGDKVGPKNTEDTAVPISDSDNSRSIQQALSTLEEKSNH